TLGGKPMQVLMRPITELNPYPGNPRHNDQAVDAVAASIREFGFRQPIVVDENNVIVVGETRYKAALKLGWRRVPVHVATGLTPTQLQAYRIADNKTGELADWDYELLVKELIELQEVDFDINLTGYSADELQELLQADLTNGLTDPDAIPEPPDAATTEP